MPDLTPWRKVRARYESGEFVPLHVRRMAESVLGETFVRKAPRVRGGQPARPDFRDREAGDDSFGDDGSGMVAL